MSSDSDCQVIEDSPSRKSISCENIPENFLDKLTAKKHFSQFGRINRFILRPKRYFCTVEYETSDSAERCLTEGGVFKDQKFTIYWTPDERRDTRNDEMSIQDPDVQAELDMMSGSAPSKRPKPNISVPIDTFLKKIERVPAPSIVAPPKRITNTKGKTMEVDPKLLQARLEFEQLAKQPANSAEERYRVLDARDKYIRCTMTKTKDINKATSTVGTCPDMCPERERYMRETQMQIATYEYGEGGCIDHNSAIKEYSRSSADKEFPLPHELRSEYGLKMTMMHLMQHIVDQCDDENTNLGDWYHFVWDRTRSIRKDITQQELCSLDAVELMEQCARFHIHCSARLVAEEPNIFDHKLNSENLTQCLQSLKYMYHDLKLKGITCPNEAEFRAYVVLLNMNHGNFLYEFKQIDDSILHSKEMKFALGAYFALDSNNYIKFFNLVKSTSYLNACIILRYFNQVRLKALNIIMKAYTARTPTNISISYLTDILAFEDDEATVAFLEYFGLSCDTTSDSVYMDRKNFFYPELPYGSDRAYNVVESKRDISVGDTIAGYEVTDVDTYDDHEVEDSFDENGYFKEELYRDIVKVSKVKEDIPDETDHVFKVPSPTSISPKFMLQKTANTQGNIHSRLGSRVDNPPSVFSKQPPVGIQGITPISSANNIFGTSQAAKPPSTNIFGTSTTSENPFRASSGSVFGSVTKNGDAGSVFGKAPVFGSSAFGGTQQSSFGTSIFGQAAKVDPIKTREEEIRKLKEAEMAKLKALQENNERMAKQIAEQKEQERLRLEEEKRQKEELLRKQQQEEEERVAREELMKAEERRMKLKEENRKRIDRNSETVYDEITDEVMVEQVQEVAEKYYHDYEIMKLVPPRIFSEISNEVINEYVIDSLLEEAIVDKMQKDRNIRMMAKYFTGWRKNVNRMLDNRMKIENTPCWVSGKTVSQNANECFSPNQEVALKNIKRYVAGSPETVKIPKEDGTKIDIIELLKNKLLNQKDRLTNGMIRSRVYWKVALSIPFNEEEGSSGFYYYIKKWLEQIFEKTEQENGKCLILDIKAPKNFYEQVVLCVRLLKGAKILNENDEVEPAAVDNSNGLLFFMTSLDVAKAKHRLHNLLKNAYTWGPVPVTVVVYDAKNCTVEDISLKLGADELFEQQKITDLDIIIHDTKSLKPVVESALLSFADNRNESSGSSLEMVSNVSFISSTLGDEFWQRIRLSAERNEKLSKATYNPNALIKIYNQAIDRIINVVQHNFSVYPDFPREFEKFVPKRLYDIPLGVEYFPADWKNVDRQKRLIKYFNALKIKPMHSELFHDYGSIETKIQEFVKANLGETRKTNRIANLMYREILCQNHKECKMVCWTNVIAVYTNEVLQIRWNELGSSLPNEVVYCTSELNSFAKMLWWLKDLQVDVNQNSVRHVESTIVQPLAKKQKLAISFTKDEMNKILEKGWRMVKLADEKLSKSRELENSTKTISKDLDETLYEQEKSMRLNRRIWNDSIRK